MQTVKWIGFGVSNALSRTVVHFFPSGGGVTAPYPANCTLNLFGLILDEGVVTGKRDSNEWKIVLEGARLSQPDGVRLDQAFEDLAQGVKGFFGITVELSTGQPKVDLAGSSCIIEHSSRANSVRFYPKSLFAPLMVEQVIPPPLVAAIEDKLTSTALIIVNGSHAVFEPKLQFLGTAADSKERLQRTISAPTVPAQSVAEVAIPAECYANLSPFDGDGGVIRCGGLYSEALPEDVAIFALYRDVTTKRPISVGAL